MKAAYVASEHMGIMKTISFEVYFYFAIMESNINQLENNSNSLFAVGMPW